MSTNVETIEPNIAGKPKRDKREKFVELAQKRTKNAIRAIRAIGKLGNKAHYDYSEKDVKKIASALNREVQEMKSKMDHHDARDDIDFTLGDR